MSKHLKKFLLHTDYVTFTLSNNFILPNVSLCNNNEVHYNPWVETRVVAKYNVTSTSDPTQLFYDDAISLFSEIEIDGIVQLSVISVYTFNTIGEHTVKYTLTDPTYIGLNAFRSCTSLTSIDIPDSVTSIDSGTFYDCSGLTTCTIGSSVTSISMYAFYNCSSLTSIVSNATTAPTISGHTFQDVKTGGTLTVPSGSTGYNVWMGTGDYYLGKYNWTKVEQ